MYNHVETCIGNLRSYWEDRSLRGRGGGQQRKGAGSKKNKTRLPKAFWVTTPGPLRYHTSWSCKTEEADFFFVSAAVRSNKDMGGTSVSFKYSSHVKVVNVGSLNTPPTKGAAKGVSKKEMKKIPNYESGARAIPTYPTGTTRT